MESNTENSLCYGDVITLNQAFMYLSARSVMEKKVYFVKVLNNRVNISKYENFNECEFIVLPKLSYESFKNWKKSLQQTTTVEQQQILYKRFQNEENNNKSLIQKMHGRPVTFGSEVILQHRYSGAFVKASKEKNEKKYMENNLQNLKIEKDLDKMCIWRMKVDVNDALKKEGDIISFDDGVVLESLKLKTVISGANSQLIEEFTQESREKLEKSLPKAHQRINYINLMERSYTFELYQAGHLLPAEGKRERGDGKRAEDKEKSRKTEVRETEPTMIALIKRTAEAAFVANPTGLGEPENSAHLQKREIRYGDFVRVKNVNRNRKEVSYLSCELNVNGWYPEALLRSDLREGEGEDEEGAVSISEVFQVIPDNVGRDTNIYGDSLSEEEEAQQRIGQPVLFKDRNEEDTRLLLRHWVSGRFLSVRGTEALEKSLSEFLREQQISKREFDNLDEFPISKGTRVDKLKRAINQGKKAQKQENQGVLDKLFGRGESAATKEVREKQLRLHQYIEQCKICLVPSHETERSLTTDSIFMVTDLTQRKRQAGLQVSSVALAGQPQLQQPQPQLEPAEPKYLKFDDGEPSQALELIPYRIRQEGWVNSDVCNLAIVPSTYYDKVKYIKQQRAENKFDFFCLEVVDDRVIRDVMDVSSLIRPLVELSEYTEFYFRSVKGSGVAQIAERQTQIQLLGDCISALVQLGRWLCESEESDLRAMGRQPAPAAWRRQRVLFELSVLEMLIKVLEFVHRGKVLEPRKPEELRNEGNQQAQIQQAYEKKRFLAATIVDFLCLAVRGSHLNSSLCYQWYQLFRTIVLDQQLDDTIRMDLLVQQLLRETDYQGNPDDEARLVARYLRFEHHNNQALNLLISYCVLGVELQQGLGLSQDRRESMIADLFSREMQGNIFRAFAHREGRFQVLVDEAAQKWEAVDAQLERESPPKFQYICKVLHLLAELCRLNQNLMMPHLERLCSFETCVQVFSDSGVSPVIRASVLKLFQHSYLVVDSVFCQPIQFPNHIKRFQQSAEQPVARAQQASSLVVTVAASEQQKFQEKYRQKLIQKFEGREALDLTDFLQATLIELILQDIPRLESQDNPIVRSHLELLNYFLQRGFFGLAQVAELHKLLDELLKTALLFLLRKKEALRARESRDSSGAHVRPEKDFDLKQAYQWICEIFRAIHFIELYQRDSMIDEFMQDKEQYDLFSRSLDHFIRLVQQQLQSNQLGQNLLRSGSIHSQRSRTRISKQITSGLNGPFFSKKGGPVEEREFSPAQVLVRYWRQNQELKKENITSFIQCIESPAPEQIYYYLSALRLEDTRVTGQVVTLLSQVFSLRKNLLVLFNEMCLLNADNQQFFEIFSSSHAQLFEHFQRFRKMAPEKNNEAFRLLYDKMDNCLQRIVRTLFRDYSDDQDRKVYLDLGVAELEERHNMIDVQQHIHPRFFNSDDRSRLLSPQSGRQAGKDGAAASSEVGFQGRAEPERQKRKSVLEQAGQQLIKDEAQKTRQPLVWVLNQMFTFDIKTCHVKQELLRNLQVHELVIRITNQVSQSLARRTSGRRNFNVTEKEQLLEKCLLLLIFFSIKNFKNSNLIARHPEFTTLVKNLLEVESKQLQNYALILVSELYRDNYNLMIDVLSQKNDLIRQLFQKFLSYYSLRDYQFCTNFFQLFSFFYQVKSASLLQNQIFLFNQLIVEKSGDLRAKIQEFLLQPKNFKVSQQQGAQEPALSARNFVTFSSLQNPSQRRAVDAVSWTQKQPQPQQLSSQRLPDLQIIVPPQVVLCSVFLGQLTQLISSGKQNSKVFSEVVEVISLAEISRMLAEGDRWWFLKLYVVEFLTKVYLRFGKKDELQRKQIAELFQRDLRAELQAYVSELRGAGETRYLGYRFVSRENNLFQKSLFHSTPEKLVDVPYELAYHQFIVLGVVESVREYLRDLGSNFNQIDFDFLLDYEGLLREVHECWEAQREQDEQLTALARQLAQPDSVQHQQQAKELNRHFSYQRSGGSQEGGEPVAQQLYGMLSQEAQFEDAKRRLEEACSRLSEHVVAHQCRERTATPYLAKAESIWEGYKGWFYSVIDFRTIEYHSLEEAQFLIGLLVKMREENVQEFKSVIRSLISALQDRETTEDVKKNAIFILRQLANFRLSERQGAQIRQDLCELGYTSFLAEAIVKEVSNSSKEEYIKALVDFLDEGQQIQDNLLEYMYADEENLFLRTIVEYMRFNFEDFLEYEKGLENTKAQSDNIYLELRAVIDKKIESFSNAIWVLKMGCEGHNERFQRYMHEQCVPPSGEPHPHNVPILELVIEWFSQYIRVFDKYNIRLGDKILDFLIEVVQGPCASNQLYMSETKVLEYLEDVVFKIVPSETQESSEILRCARLEDLDLSSFSRRLYTFLLSLFEGSTSPLLVEKIENHINISILLRRLQYIWYNFIRPPKKDLQDVIVELYKDQEEDRAAEKEEIKLAQKNMGMESSSEPGYDDLIIFNQQKSDELRDEDILEEYQQKLADLREEGALIYILIQSLCHQSPAFKQRFKSTKHQMLQSYSIHDQKQQAIFEKVILYYKLNTGRIEILNSQNELQLLFFRKPDLSQFLTPSTQELFLNEVSRDSANDKINGLLMKRNDFIDEMVHNQFLRNHVPIDLDNWFTTTRWIALLSAFVINFLILFDEFTESCERCTAAFAEDPESRCVCPFDTPTRLGRGINIFGIILFVLNVLIFVIWACLKLKLDLKNALNLWDLQIKKLKKERKKEKKSKLETNIIPIEVQKVIEAAQEIQQYIQDELHKYLFLIRYMFLNSYFLYLSLYAAVTILGIVINRLFFTLLLLDIIERSQILQNVIKAVSMNAYQLFMTGLLGLVIMFIYGMVGYYNNDLHSTMQPVDYDTEFCVDPLNCFIYVLNVGLRAGGGVGEQLQQPHPENTSQFVSRIFWDLSFFVIIIVIWLNIIFGIIIDTFASLREQKNQQDSDAKNRCFICNVERTIFEKQGISFEMHSYKEHNVWNYFFYMVYLMQKDRMEYNGTESQIMEKIEQDDISWFPIGKARSLQSQTEEEDKTLQLLSDIKEKMDLLQKNIDKLQVLQLAEM